MIALPERAPQGGLARLLVGAVAFATVAPPALIAVPLAALLALPGPRGRRHLVAGGIAAWLGAWWLLRPGDPPDQVVRAASVLAAVTFAGLTLRWRGSFTHRALAAVAAAAVGVAGLAAVAGPSWGEVRWWAAHRVGLTARMAIGSLWGRPGTAPGDLPGWWPDPEPVEAWFAWFTAFMTDCFPALTALQLMGGLALATAVYFRIADRPHGVPLGRLRTFRFSEHLGWTAAVPLVAVVMLHHGAVRIAGANLLVVAGVLYALRGLAVAAFGVQMLGGGGLLLWLAVTVMILLMLPLVAGGAILLGVLDAGLDLRRRWTAPPTGK